MESFNNDEVKKMLEMLKEQAQSTEATEQNVTQATENNVDSADELKDMLKKQFSADEETQGDLLASDYSFDEVNDFVSEDEIEEERRVLYVAMTRARDRMIMTFAAQKLADRLQDIVLRMDMSPKELMTANISCPGSWVLQTALSRTEAGEFFQLAGYPEQIQVSKNPWSIHVAHAQPPTAIVLDESSPAETITEEINP